MTPEFWAEQETPTVQKVVDAFISLVNERGYARLTITDIARQAGVSRMTFYRRFASKEAVAKLFIETCCRRIAALFEQSPAPTQLPEYFSALFRRISGYSRLIHELYEANLGQYILSAINQALFRTPLRQGLVQLNGYARRFYAGAFYNVMIQWIQNQMKESAEEMAQCYCGLLPA